MPPANSVTLDQRKIFILPTRQCTLPGLCHGEGINYQNSLIFALAFLLVSLFMVGMLHTYRNLSGLTLVAGSTRPASPARIQVLKRLGDTYESSSGWNRELLSRASWCRIRKFVLLSMLKKEASNHVQTFYPLGLFRSWSWVDLVLCQLPVVK